MSQLVGTASVNWGFDPLYTWARKPGLDQMLDEMARAGYAGTEISYNFPPAAKETKTALQRHGLRAAGTFHALDLRERSRHPDELAALEPVARRLSAVGGRDIILSDRPSAERIAIAGRVQNNGSDGLSATAWRAVADGLNAAAELLTGLNMRASFHPHVGTFVETRTEIDTLCALTDSALLKLCPDTGHLAYAGVEPEAIFADYESRIGYVHLKDVDPEKLADIRSRQVGFVQAVRTGLFVELGRGMVRFDSIVGSLRNARYDGWLIVEQDAPQHPFESAANNRRYLRDRFGL